MQMAGQAQGVGATLATWLKENVPGIRDAHGQVRGWKDRQQGSFSANARAMMRPRQHWKGQEKGGYAPQGAESYGEGKGPERKRRRREESRGTAAGGRRKEGKAQSQGEGIAGLSATIIGRSVQSKFELVGRVRSPTSLALVVRTVSFL